MTTIYGNVMYGGHPGTAYTQKIEEQAETLQYPIDRDALYGERARQLKPIGTLSKGISTLDILEGDLVLVPRTGLWKKVAISKSAFSAFNGLMHEETTTLKEFHEAFKAGGFASSNYFMKERGASSHLIDSYGIGKAHFRNGCDRLVQPGEMLSWIPDIDPFVQEVAAKNSQEPAKKKIKLSGDIVVKALVVPAKDVREKILTESQEALFTAWSSAKTKVLAADNSKKLSDSLLPLMSTAFSDVITIHDIAFAECVEATKPGETGACVFVW